MGCISSLGHNRPEFARRILLGECGIAPITLFDTEGFRVKVAAEVKDYNELDQFTEKQLSKLDRFTQFAMIASREAVKDSGLDLTGPLAERMAVVHGTGVGGQTTQEQGYHRVYALGSKRLHPFTVPKLIPCAGTSWISMDLGITGPAFATTSACSSASHAIGMALLMIRSGIVDAAVAGGSEALITLATIKAWESLRVMSRDTCRPFSLQRTGMVIGEGAGSIILESLDHARARGAEIYAELKGFGMSSDAHDMLQPLAEGAGRAIQAALTDAGIAADSVDYINAHGTATVQNDLTETQAIHNVFGDHAGKLAVSSTKAMHGHTLGAAAALEAIATITALLEQVAPPTINYIDPDPQCDLDYVINAARSMPIKTALSNSFAFGGLNTVLVFSQYNGD